MYSEKLPMIDRGTGRNMYSLIPKTNKFEKLVHLVGFGIRSKKEFLVLLMSDVGIDENVLT